MADLASRHGYRIAVDKGLTPIIPSKRSKAVPLISPTRDHTPSADEISQAQSIISASDSCRSSLNSTRDDVFSVRSGQSTNTSELPTAFVEGWKDATRQAHAEQTHVYTDVDRFALDIARVLDVQLASGSPLMPAQASGTKSTGEVELFFPSLFRSICICDISIIGNPIRLHSRHFSLGPRGLKIGQAQFLNLPHQQKHACHLSFQPGPYKKPQFILEYANALLSAETDGTAYVLATQMDVTTIIYQLAEVLNAKYWMQRRLSDGNEEVSMTNELDWTALASEYVGSSERCNDDPRMKKERLIMNDVNAWEFSEIVEDIKHFHSEYFTLALSFDGDEPSWQISYTSPVLATKLDDVKASFSQSSPEVMTQLGDLLTGDAEAALPIRWGVQGETKWLYCCPMFRGRKECWLCFLSSGEVGNLWNLKYSKTPSP